MTFSEMKQRGRDFGMKGSATAQHDCLSQKTTGRVPN